MARFYGTVRGNGGDTSRIGHPSTGVYVTAQSLSGDVCVFMNDHGGEDYCTITFRKHGGNGKSHFFYSGKVADAIHNRDTLLQHAAAQVLGRRV